MMARAEKLFASMRANPRDWTIADIERVCRLHGLRCDKPSSGSHYKVSHPDLAQIHTVPFKRPIKPVYIRTLLNMIDQIEARK